MERSFLKECYIFNIFGLFPFPRFFAESREASKKSSNGFAGQGEGRNIKKKILKVCKEEGPTWQRIQ